MRRINVVAGIRSVFDRENFFQLFNLEEDFLIDTARLDAAYLRLYDILNKQLLETSNDVEKEFLSSYLAMLNEGYDVLKDDMKRAEHLILQNDTSIPIPSQAFISSVFDSSEEDIEGMKLDIRTAMVSAFKKRDFENAALEYAKLKVLSKLN